MITTFEQKRGINLRKFTLYQDKILVETKSLRKNNKYEVEFEKLGRKVSYQSESTLPGKIMFFVCIAIPVGILIAYFTTDSIDFRSILLNLILWPILALWSFFKQHQDDIFLTCGAVNLVFYRTIPNEKSVLDFIKTIKTTVKYYMKNKYAEVNLNIPEEIFLGRLNWLKVNEIIDENELLELKAEYQIMKYCNVILSYIFHLLHE